MENASDLSTVDTKQISALESVRDHFKELKAFYAQILKIDVDYGTIPGVAKPCLYKPGAEKLKLLFNLSVEVQRTSELLDLNTMFYDASYKTIVRKMDGTISAECEGSCNSFEDKYKYIYKIREQQPAGPTDETQNLERMKLGRWKNYNGLQFWEDKAENMNRIALKNTIQKMAQKRSMVGAILIATGASTIFTTDIKDEDGTNEDLVNQAMDELSKVATIDELKDLVGRYEPVYNADTKFTKAAKELKERLVKK